MSLKEYKIIAKAINNATDIGEPHLVHKDQLTLELVSAFRNIDASFNGFDFLKECGDSTFTEPFLTRRDKDHKKFL